MNVLNPDNIKQAVQTALNEDIGSGDITAALVPPDQWINAKLIVREPAILCGQPWFNDVFNQVDERVTVTWHKHDSDDCRADDVICEIYGPARAILTGERTAINFLQTLSGTATTTQALAKRLAGTGTKLLDTRKTLPGLREAQKYAVHCGGGMNHRMGLYDAFLIKENHIMAAGSITQAVEAAKKMAPGRSVEVEVEDLNELEEAIRAQADIVMLDNFNHEDMKTAVAVAKGKVKLEASGNVSEQTIEAIAETGVDFVSVGALTKHVRAIDFSLRFDK